MDGLGTANHEGESHPIVTVVIPCYNHARYVERSINSVLEQDYANIQLIVVDDGSSDGSVELIEALSRRNPFVFVKQKNSGVCRALNRGIREHGVGEYVAILASDDYWRSDKIRLQVEAMRSSACSEFCFSRARVFYENNRCGFRLGRIFPGRCLKGRVLNSVFMRQHVPAGTMLFSRLLFDRVGGFDEGLKEEDWDFVIRCASETEFVGINEPLLFYRLHEGNTMKTAGRSSIFCQKAKILSKNIHLVGPWRWIASIVVHFVHDMIVCKLFDLILFWRKHA